MFIYPWCPKCRSEAKRSDVPYGHVSMLLLGDGNEATEPKNEYEPLQINQVPCISAVTALILFRFENWLFCLILKLAVLSRIHEKHQGHFFLEVSKQL